MVASRSEWYVRDSLNNQSALVTPVDYSLWRITVQVTKDNLLSHIVKLWYHTEGYSDKFAFDAGPSLKSGFAKVGLFPSSPDVIRVTVGAHNDPQTFLEPRIESIEQNFEPLFHLLQTRYNISSEKNLEEYEQFILLKQKGITPGVVLANSIQKYLFDQTPQKQRRQKNKPLSTEAGVLVTSDSFVALTKSLHEAKKAKKDIINMGTTITSKRRQFCIDWYESFRWQARMELELHTPLYKRRYLSHLSRCWKRILGSKN